MLAEEWTGAASERAKKGAVFLERYRCVPTLFCPLGLINLLGRSASAADDRMGLLGWSGPRQEPR